MPLVVAARPPLAPPSPPPDRALPALPAALDPEAAAATLQGWLGRSGLVVRSCVPTYVRYKPGTNATVRYDVELAAGATIWRRWVVVRLLPAGLAEQEFGRRRVGRLVDAYGRLPDVPPIADPATVLPEFGAFALLFPVDPKLPGLTAAFDPQSDLAGSDALGPDAEPREIEAVRYKPYRKALLRCGATPPFDGSGLYVKLSLPEVAPVLDRRARAFAAALRNRGVSAAAPSAWVPSLAATCYPAVPGLPLRALRGTAAALSYLPAVAAAVRSLAACEVADLPPYRPADEVATLRAGAATLGCLLPGLVADLDDLLRAIEQGLARLDDDLRPAHGDCYDDQFLVGPAGLTLLDFDEARLAHPSLDPGNVLAHLHAATTDKPDGETLGNLTRAIEELVGRWAPEVGEDALAVATAAGILKLAVGPFRRLEPAWPERIAALIDRARKALPRQAPAPVLPAPGPEPHDPDLPGLARALDPARIVALVRANGQDRHPPLQLGEARIVKHRPGRRAIVRFAVHGPDGEPDALFVKVFAGDRAGRVAARTAAVHAAVAGRVRVPRLLGLDLDDRIVVLEGIAGRGLAESVRAGDLDAPARAGGALAALHGSQAVLDTRHGVEDELAATTRQLDGLTALDAGLSRSSRQAYDVVAGALLRLEPWRHLPAHRDCHPAQVLVGPRGVGFVDLDDACLTEPAVDVGNLLAHLDLEALLTPAATGDFARAADAFLAGYRTAGGVVTPRQVSTCRAVALLRLAGVHATRAGVPLGHALVEAALARAEEVAVDA